MGFRRNLMKLCAASTVVLLGMGTSPVQATQLDAMRISRTQHALPTADLANAIIWQGDVKGTPGEKLSQDLILDNGETVSIEVDWLSGLIVVDRSEHGVFEIPMDELQAAVASESQATGEMSPQRSPEDINWGSMCQWLSGLTGLGHAAIWSMVSPWIGIPYGVFWLWVGMQCK